MKYVVYVAAELDQEFALKLLAKFEAAEAQAGLLADEFSVPFDEDTNPDVVLSHARIVSMTLCAELADEEMN